MLNIPKTYLLKLAMTDPARLNTNQRIILDKFLLQHREKSSRGIIRCEGASTYQSPTPERVMKIKR